MAAKRKKNTAGAGVQPVPFEDGLTSGGDEETRATVLPNFMNGPVISVLIPSKGSPLNVLITILNLRLRASVPGRLEHIIIINHDEPLASDYQKAVDCLVSYGVNVKLLVSPVTGYRALAAMYEQAFQASSGGFIFLYNDDVTVNTTNWDEKYITALKPVRFGVACANCNEGEVVPGGGVGHYEWAFPMVRRDLCHAIGNKLCLREDLYAFDRIFDAYARLTGHGVNSQVDLVHQRTLLVPGSDRAAHYAETQANWTAYLRLWHDTAFDMQQLVHKAEQEK